MLHSDNGRPVKAVTCQVLLENDGFVKSFFYLFAFIFRSQALR